MKKSWMMTNTLTAWLTQVKLPTGNFLRKLMSCTLDWIMEVEVSAFIGARPHQRRSQRSNQRNGYRKRGWKTCVGYLELLIPKLRKGSYFPQFLKRRCLVEETLLGVVREAWVQGVSTRSMKRLAEALGTTNLSRSQVSRICRELDQRVQEFRQRPIEGDWMFLWLDATYLKVRLNGQFGRPHEFDGGQDGISPRHGRCTCRVLLRRGWQPGGRPLAMAGSWRFALQDFAAERTRKVLENSNGFWQFRRPHEFDGGQDGILPRHGRCTMRVLLCWGDGRRVGARSPRPGAGGSLSRISLPRGRGKYLTT